MRTKLKKALSGVAALAVAAAAGPLLSITPAGATHGGDPVPGTLNGSLSLSPPSGDSQQDFALDPDDPQVCPGDGATDGYRYQTYFVDARNDPATLTYGNTGPNNVAIGFGSPLVDPFGRPVVNQNPDIGTANISGIPVMDFSVFPPGTIPEGEYFLGIACTKDTHTETYWQLRVAITTNDGDGAANFDYAVVAEPAAPAAPVLDSVTPGNGELTAAFTPVESTPPTDSFTVTATPGGGGTPVTATGTASPITVTGLANGTEYSVTVRATNTEGDSPESNAITATPFDANLQPAVQNLTYSDVGASGSGEILVDWDAPSSGATPTGYEVTLNPAEGTVTVDDTTTQASVTGLAPGTAYTVTVTPLHADPLYGTPASITATPLASGVTTLEQNVTVTRPAGSVVFTQICEDSQAGTPLPGAEFGTGPCAIAFGVAERVKPSGGGTPYFEATASLNNVMVDSFGDDTGWTVTGQMSAFVSPGPGPDRTFSGDQLGWVPALARATDGLGVDLGASVAPGTTDGLGNGETLASSPAGSSLGIAEFDAALTVQIPMKNKAGEYSGTLTMTATPGV